MRSSAILIVISCLLLSTAISQQPGTVSPNVKLLDADKFTNFVDGVAVITKGMASALINAKGEYVIPFNKYSSFAQCRPGVNLIVVGVSGRSALINTAGKELVGLTTARIRPEIVDKDGYILIHPDNSIGGDMYVNSRGHTIKVLKDKLSLKRDECQNNLCPFWDKNFDKLGLSDREGNIKLSPEYHYYKGFSEELACIGKKNEFGEMKYGFIDKSGKVVIPLVYSNAPTSFNNGLSLVKPVKAEEFNYALIDKAGNIKFKIGNSPNGKPMHPIDNRKCEFIAGFSRWQVQGGINYFVDLSGKVISEKEYLTSIGLGDLNGNVYLNFRENTEAIVQYLGNRSLSGLVNLKTKKVIPALFKVAQTTDLDPVSGLTYGSITNSGKIIEGYFDRDGVFVMVKSEGSKW